MKKSSRSLILIRHAHRDTKNRALDNGLSTKGKQQVVGLVPLALKRFADSKTPPSKKVSVIFLTSPKRRCTETIEPIATRVKAKVDMDSLLLECQPRESQAMFQGRIRKWCMQWKKSTAPITVISSHGDWIPMAVEQLTGATVVSKKGSWIEIRLEKNRAKLYTVIQNARRNY